MMHCYYTLLLPALLLRHLRLFTYQDIFISFVSMCVDTKLYAGGLVQALAFPTNLGPFGNALVRTN